MDKHEVNIYLSRILSGYYVFLCNNKKYKLIYPNISVKYEAELLAAEEYENNKYNSWLSDQDILYHLISFGLWTPNGDDQLEKMEKEIEDQKIELFKNFLNPARAKSIRKTLANYKQAYNKNYNIRHSYDHYTLQGYCDIIKSQYILINSLFDTNNNKIFNTLNDTDHTELSKISSVISNNSIEMTEFRKIARSELWRNYWSANKDQLFDKATINWTDEQKTLVVISKMYDGAYEHPECPPDKVFEDDDAFDGWSLHQRKENEKLRSKGRAEKMLQGKNLDKAQEVFIVANSSDEANDIYNLNDNVSRSIIKERNNAVTNSAKPINDANLPDVQRNLMMESNKKIMERAKK